MQSVDEKNDFMEQAMEKFGECLASLGTEKIQNFDFKKVGIMLNIENHPDKMNVSCVVKIDDEVHKEILG